MSDILDLDAVGQAALVASGAVSALELVDAAIARIERLEPTVHALASTDFERARARAGKPLAGPLAGVPFLIKDVLPYPDSSSHLANPPGFSARSSAWAPRT